MHQMRTLAWRQSAVIGVLAGAVLLVQGFLFFSLKGVAESQNGQQEHRDFEAAIQHLVLLTVNAEATARAYSITGDEITRQEYAQLRRKAETELDAVSALRLHFQDDRVSKLGALIRRRFDLLDEGIRLRDEQGPDALAGFIRALPPLTADITLLGEEITADSAADAEADARAADRRALYAGIAALVSTIASFGFLAWVAVLNVRSASRARSAEADLRRRFAAFSEAMPAAAFSITADHTVVDWNAAASEKFGVEPGAAIGARLTGIVPAEPAARIIAAAGRALATAQPVDLDLVLDRGAAPPLELQGAVFPILGGEEPRIGAVLRDQTALLQAQRAEAAARHTMSLVVESSVEAVVTVDRGGRILQFNPAAESSFKIPAAEAIGRDLIDFIADDHRHALLAALGTTNQGDGAAEGTGPIRLRVRPSDGNEFPVEVHVARLAGAGEAAAVVTLRDLTEQEEWERAVTEARLQAEAANLAKSQFLSRMSHELRTPMNVILGFSQILQLDDTASDDQKESVGHILKAGKHLLSLIDEVLDISRIESGDVSFSLEPVVLADLVAECVDLLRPLAASNEVRFQTNAQSCGHTVMADKQRLKQVILNLLSNAIKYNVPQGMVDLTCDHPGNGMVRLRVRDTGFGMTETQLAKLFQPFERLGAERSSVPGTGLGLALSKGLVEAMSGRIGVSSEPGVGSTFWVDLPEVIVPAAAPPAAADAPVITRLRRRSRATVLYIEDNLENLRVIERILPLFGDIQLIPAMQGRIGVDLAQQVAPDLILLDLNLPDLPGTEVLRLLRRDPRTRDVPVAIITADASAHQQQRLFEAGASAYLTKPIDVPVFLATLARFLDEPDAGD
jgi:PAS domain S-box-containing protein